MVSGRFQGWAKKQSFFKYEVCRRNRGNNVEWEQGPATGLKWEDEPCVCVCVCVLRILVSSSMQMRGGVGCLSIHSCIDWLINTEALTCWIWNMSSVIKLTQNQNWAYFTFAFYFTYCYKKKCVFVIFNQNVITYYEMTFFFHWRWIMLTNSQMAT